MAYPPIAEEELPPLDECGALPEADDARDLWRAVLARAFADACAAEPVSVLDRDRARNWLLYGGPRFGRACEFAGYDPVRVRLKAIALNAADWSPEMLNAER